MSYPTLIFKVAEKNVAQPFQRNASDTRLQPSKGLTKALDEDADASEEGSIEGYEIEDESRYEDVQFKTNYLAVCLECACVSCPFLPHAILNIGNLQT
jgi:hypothetical protein